jgi:hypothetical protein
MHLSIALVADALERSRLAALPGREQAEHNGDPLPSYADCWSSNRGITDPNASGSSWSAAAESRSNRHRDVNLRYDIA